ncbi:MAG TPA: hypothetical protein VNP92_15365 [Actinophytocola sp.]|nr:hypothetical protein [Actinophytocola sp.]
MGGDLEAWLVERVVTLHASGPYRPPTPAERARGVAGLRALLAGATPESLRGLGFAVTAGPGHTLVAGHGAARAWGALVLGATPPQRVIEVPHPKSDRRTARLGLELFLATTGSALLVAGAHRDAAGGAADVAHRDDSMFHAFAGVLAERAGAEIQLHGYATATLPGVDAVVSPGAGTVLPEHTALRDALADNGFRVHEGQTGTLDGATNVQGIAAATRGTPFLHLELAPGARADPTHRAAVVAAITATWP